MHEKLTRKELREMRIGEERTIQLSDRKKIESARQTVRQVSFEDDMEFTFKPDKDAVAVTIARTK